MDNHRDAAADVLVIFGITGDLARRMTFRALYRLELRGHFGLPVARAALTSTTCAPAQPRASLGPAP